MNAPFGKSNVGRPFCGISEHVLEAARANQYRWVNKRSLGWVWLDRLPGATVDQLVACAGWALAQIAGCCGMEFGQVAVGGQADLLLLTQNIDGRSGTLAQFQLPPGNDQQLRGWFDVSETWHFDPTTPCPSNKIDLPAVMCHELCHGMGLSHTDVPGSLMNPYYNPEIRTPQAWEVQELQARYGPPRAKPAPPTPGAPASPPSAGGDGYPAQITLSAQYGAAAYAGPAKRVW